MHAAVRDVEAAEAMFGRHERLHAVRRDIRDPGPLGALVGDVRPEELYNLAGESSVGASFADPRATWESNAHVVVHLLDAIRNDSPETRFYQASSGEMFGSVPGRERRPRRDRRAQPAEPVRGREGGRAHALPQLPRVVRDPDRLRDPLQPRVAPPRAAVPLAQGRRPRAGAAGGKRAGPLALGNLKAQRDWGFAPDYVDGMIAILRQARSGGVPDEAASYRDYVLGTGRLHHVWELADRAFALAGFELAWSLEGDDPLGWSASFAELGRAGRGRRPGLHPPVRPEGDRRRSVPDRRRARLAAAPGLDVFLEDMLATSPKKPRR